MTAMIRLLVLALLVGAVSPTTAIAATWRVDVIVFSDRHFNAWSEAKIAPEPYNANQAIPLDDSARLAAGGIHVLGAEDSVLRQQWSRLNNSSRFQPVVRVAWLQDDPPQRGGPELLLRHGPVIATGHGPLAQLEGTLRLTLRRYLHLDVDLQWTDDDGREHRAVTLREQRRMRSGELHYFDNPRFGVLAHVQRVDEE